MLLTVGTVVRKLLESKYALNNEESGIRSIKYSLL